MLDGHDARVCKDLFWEVVDELAVDKAVEALADYVLHLGSHLLLLRLLYVRHLHTSQGLGLGVRKWCAGVTTCSKPQSPWC